MVLLDEIRVLFTGVWRAPRSFLVRRGLYYSGIPDSVVRRHFDLLRRGGWMNFHMHYPEMRAYLPNSNALDDYTRYLENQVRIARRGR